MIEELKKLLILHEGKKRSLYFCSADKPTIGVGRNVSEGGIPLSDDEIDLMLTNDICRVQDELRNSFNWYEDLDGVRKAALCDLCFNIGLPSLKGFKLALGHMADHNYDNASVEFLNSKWAKDVGPLRSITITDMIRTGKYQ